jgi:hypothetical protein
MEASVDSSSTPHGAPFHSLAGLKFFAKLVKETTVLNPKDVLKSVGEVEDYIKGIVPALPITPLKDISPFDIIVNKQSWIVLQLDPSVKNWQFCIGEHGCTTKEERSEIRNWWLKHYYGKNGFDHGVVSDNGCRILYFGVVKRGSAFVVDINNPPSELFNIHVEFVQVDKDKGVDVEKRLKVIFDPDVSNDGGSFP